ncbi:mRNA turnover protein 4 [Nematocida sp. AWRm77]|nr:mRNA turnover protein 4 [Nematocida sp. AWRm77]
MNKTLEKRAKVNSALSNLSSYKTIYRILCDNKTPFIQRIRQVLRSKKSEMIFGKYKMIEKVLSQTFSSEEMNKLKGASLYKRSDKIYCYVLTDLEEEEIQKMIASIAFSDYEQKGSQFASDFILPAGELLTEDNTRVSHTLFKDLLALGLHNIQMNPKTNNIEVTEETVIGRRGEEITKEQERLLKLLGIKNKQFKVSIVGKLPIPQE